MKIKSGQLIGTLDISSSGAEKELIPRSPPAMLSIKDFCIMNYNDCHISINEGPFVFFKASTGYQSFKQVSSCKIKENNILFVWLGIVDIDIFECDIDESVLGGGGV